MAAIAVNDDNVVITDDENTASDDDDNDDDNADADDADDVTVASVDADDVTDGDEDDEVDELSDVETDAHMSDVQSEKRQKLKAVVDKLLASKDSATFMKAKVMTVGQGGGGKTSLIAALLGQEFDPLQASTRGADESDVTVESMEAQHWKVLSQCVFVSMKC